MPYASLLTSNGEQIKVLVDDNGFIKTTTNNADYNSPTGGSGTVESVTAETADAIDQADPANPVLQDASAANAGTMPANMFVFQPKFLADADLSAGNATVTPGATAGAVVVPSGLGGQNRTLTVSTTDAVNKQDFHVIVRDTSANSVTIVTSAGGGTLFTHGPNAAAVMVYKCYFNVNNWTGAEMYPGN